MNNDSKKHSILMQACTFVVIWPLLLTIICLEFIIRQQQLISCQLAQELLEKEALIHHLSSTENS